MDFRINTSIKMLDVEEEISPANLVTARDYPPSFRTKLAHPDDYKITNYAIKPDFFLYSFDGHTRAFARLAIKVDETSWTSATFILDTGACSHLYVCSDLRSLIEPRIREDDLGYNYIKVEDGGLGKKLRIQDVPANHAQANIIGIKLLQKGRFRFLDNDLSFDAEHRAHNAFAFDAKCI